MKHFFLLFLLFAVIVPLQAQDAEVDVQKKIVSINGTDFFRIERERAGNDVMLYDLKTDDIVIKLLSMDNGTPTYPQDDYRRLVFVAANKFLETRKFNGYPMQNILQKMIKRKTMGVDGVLNPDKIGEFILEFDEQITERTINVN